MRNFNAIFKREFASYIHSPVIYVFLIFFLILNGVFTMKLGQFYETGQADLRIFFMWHPWLYLFLIPAVSMRLWSEERKSGTIELLFTLPTTMMETMLGKFFAAWLFTTIALILTFPMVLTVMYLGKPDLGVIITQYIGSILLSGSYLAIGSFFSATTKSQVVSFILTFVTCLFLILIGFPPFLQIFQDLSFPLWFLEEIGYFSFYTNFTAVQKGILDFRDIFYFISIMAAFLFGGALVLENRKAL